MAKPKRSAADLDAELAALEAELAALGQKKAKPAAPPAPKAEPKPEPPTPAPEVPAPQPEAPTPEPVEKKRFGLKLPKREKRAAEPEPAPAPTPEPAPEPAKAQRAAPPPPAPLPKFDASLWREEDGAWVRAVPGEARVVRRILDEKGEVVREEPASMRDLEEETPVRAERGFGKLLRRKGK